MTRVKAAKKPSDEAKAKFNAILAQDYKLAETYLKDIIKKEYPLECQKYLIYRQSSLHNYSICYVDKFDKFNEDYLKCIRSVNPYIAEMYYNILCSAANAMFKTKHNRHYSGQLAFIKLRLQYIENAKSLPITVYNDDSKYDIEKRIIRKWEELEKNINECSRFLNQEYDDEYICNLINTLNYIWCSSIWCTYSGSLVYVNKTVGYKKDVKFFINKFENFYSPLKKKEIANQQEAERKKREEAERLERELKVKQAFAKEVIFWEQYIYLLKSGKAKKAFALLEETKKPSDTDEFTKFKKGVLGVKYLGKVSSLEAKTLAELSLEKSH